MKKKGIVLAVWILVLALLTGCEGSVEEILQKLYPAKDESVAAQQEAARNATEEEPETTAVVTRTYAAIESFGLAYQPDYGLDPYNCESMNNRVILSFVYEPLFAVTSEFDPVAILATDYETSEGGKVTTIHLRSGIRFHNGKRLTAEDVVYSIKASIGSSYYGTRLRFVESIEAADTETVVIRTTESYECLPLLLDMAIIPKDADTASFPAGTGPYSNDGKGTLHQNESWWQDTAFLVEFSEISLVEVDSSADTRDQFEYQNVNLVLTDPNSSAFAGFHNDNELWTQTTTLLEYIGYNISSEIFSNYALRGAITYAIERQTLAEDVMGGFAEATTLPCTPDSRFYDAKLAAEYDDSAAKFEERVASAEIKDADGDGILDMYISSKGYYVPVKGTMLVCSTNYLRVQSANAIAEMLNEMGLDITVQTMEYNEYKTALLEGEFELYYGESRLSPNFDLSPFFGATGTLNYGSLENSTMMNLCSMALSNSGNAYNLYQRVCDRGYITPIMVKSHAIYATRGAVREPAGFVDWLLPMSYQEGVTQTAESLADVITEEEQTVAAEEAEASEETEAAATEVPAE